jgi:NAD-dependent dihydropyrimidine dehydrogenase PreA subunit
VAYVINEPCIGTKDTSCVEVCPVDCVHPRPDEPDFGQAEQLYIDPEECIDCHRRLESRRLFAGPAAVFALAAAAAVVRSGQPFGHGWWLVAFLALVGGLSQVALGGGQRALAGAPAILAVGSVALLAALAPAAATRAPPGRGPDDHRSRLYAYRAVIIFLTGNVLVGTGLTEALPWQ